jgi:hypothetical protein
MRVEQVMDDAGERSRRVIQPRAKASDRTIPRHQPPPSLLIDFGWQRGLVEIEIASPQLVPSRPIGGPQLGYHDLAHRECLTLIVTGTTTWQVLGERNRFIGSALSGCHLRGTGMVDEDVQRSAEELRETAAKLRQLARQTRFASTRRELLGLAERFETIAAQLDEGGPPPQSGG